MFVHIKKLEPNNYETLPHCLIKDYGLIAYKHFEAKVVVKIIR